MKPGKTRVVENVVSIPSGVYFIRVFCTKGYIDTQAFVKL